MAFDILILGKVIGECIGWDQMALAELMFYSIRVNELGRRFMPKFEDGKDLAVNFETGKVIQYDSESKEGDEGNGNPIEMQVDWSVFNT